MNKEQKSGIGLNVIIAVLLCATAVGLLIHNLQGGGIEKSIESEVDRMNAVTSVDLIISNAQDYYNENKDLFSDKQDLIFDFTIKTDNGQYKSGRKSFIYGERATDGQIRIKSNGEISIIKAIKIKEFYCGYDTSFEGYDIRDCRAKLEQIKLAP